jgi:hypothetical protein
MNKMEISNLVCMTYFWNNLHWVRSKLKDCKAKSLRTLLIVTPLLDHTDWFLVAAIICIAVFTDVIHFNVLSTLH